ncbi:MAG: primosomal protein N' [Bacteroidetes bacterium]|nr:primosomal protein N' [Bacteroidota bacterium]
MSERLTLFAQVLLPLPIEGTYTYRVPYEWNDLVRMGQRVVVQFGSRKIYSGIITAFTETPPDKYAAQYLLELPDTEILVNPHQLAFWDWIHSYYMCHLGEVMASALPAGYRIQSETMLVLNPEFDETETLELDEKEWLILSALQKHREISVDDAARTIGQKSAVKYIKSLFLRGILSVKEELANTFKPRMEEYFRLVPEWKDEDFARNTLEKLEKRAPKQADAAMLLLGFGQKELTFRELSTRGSIERSHLRSLINKGLLIREKREVDRIAAGTGSADFELTPDQRNCVAEIQQAFQEHKPVLLHGVTGSGKTFVYMDCIRQALEAGQQVLYLIPEVALTEHLVQRLSVFFGTEMAVWHNFYSMQERTELYEKIKAGKLNLVIGPRSALFAPFSDLGLIVIDEEHENSFKQFEKRPHYHARDAALQLALLHKCKVLLGSATPSYESLEAVNRGKWHKVELNARFNPVPAPKILLVHIGEAKRQNRMKGVFSLALLEAIQQSLDKKEQILVYQNRKGYVPFITCDFCAHTSHCINCDITLTYYKAGNQQKCGYCGYTQEPPVQCPACGSGSMSMRGFGTERIAEELSVIFPDLRISRLDQESLKKRSDFQQILNGFANGEIDILVGTQLLSKGLDFSNVGLVAVPDADMLLGIPDFRTTERAFQQLYQVRGRAGRGSFQGTMLIQTSQVSHPVIQAVYEDDFYGLAKQELASRKEYAYPPYSRLIRITLKHKDLHTCRKAAEIYGDLLRPALNKRMLGPQAPSVSRIRNWHLQQILVKMDRDHDNIPKIKQFLQDKARLLQKSEGLRSTVVDFDVDPA